MRCKECGQTKPVHQFAEDRRCSTGRRNVCHDCDPRYDPNRVRYERRTSGVKRCPDCGEAKPVAAFAARATSRDGLYPRCRECQSEYWSRNRLGTTKEKDAAMWEAQRGLCYLCEEPLGTKDHPRLKPVRDHREPEGGVKVVLGWAHSDCNAGLGRLDDDPTKALRVALNAARAEHAHGLLGADTLQVMRALADEMLA